MKYLLFFQESNETNVLINNGTQSAIESRRVQSAATKGSRAASAGHTVPKISPRRPRTSRFDALNRRDTDPSIGLRNDFGSVLLRILSNIAATPDLDDAFTIRKRALEARERRLIHTKDDRYYNLVNQLAPLKIQGEKTLNHTVDEED